MFKKSKLTLAVLSAVGAASTIAIPVSVQAQQTQASASTDTITVTARRREELIQDVPGAVSAFSGEALDKAGVDDILGIADLVPNTTLKASRGTNTTLTAFIRGVGQQDPVAGYEPGVGVYLDDVYLARPQGAVMDIYDVQRVEVLRGPQGTLYGRNTIGGAVKYVTRRLGVKPELRANVTLGQYGQRDFSLTGSAAASDALRFGATLASFDRDGYGENVVNGKPNYDKDVMAARVSAE
ncbi:MAG: TonB-dependent receptor plug domain-containing protein, partial [Burkholderiaceae bacterium]